MLQLLDTLFVILNLWKVVNKGEELEDEAWSKNIKIRQTLDILTSYPKEYWKYQFIIYYIFLEMKKILKHDLLGFLNKHMTDK